MTPGRTGVPPRGAPPGRRARHGSRACRGRRGAYATGPLRPRTPGGESPRKHGCGASLQGAARREQPFRARSHGPERHSTARHGIAPRGRPGGAHRPRPDALPPAPGPSQSRASAPSPGRRSPAPSSAGGGWGGPGPVRTTAGGRHRVRRRGGPMAACPTVASLTGPLLPLPRVASPGLPCGGLPVRRSLPASPTEAAPTAASSCTREGDGGLLDEGGGRHGAALRQAGKLLRSPVGRARGACGGGGAPRT